MKVRVGKKMTKRKVKGQHPKKDDCGTMLISARSRTK
jgi:hypothetical protein